MEIGKYFKRGELALKILLEKYPNVNIKIECNEIYNGNFFYIIDSSISYSDSIWVSKNSIFYKYTLDKQIKKMVYRYLVTIKYNK